MKVGNAQGSGKYHIQAEINMIPLIDVALVLLIIFMVISPILVKSELKVKLPKVTDAGQADETAVKIEIDDRGRISLESKIIPKQNLKEAMKLEFPPGHKASLLIQADKDVSFKEVVYVMDLARQFKVEKLGVAVIPELGGP